MDGSELPEDTRLELESLPPHTPLEPERAVGDDSKVRILVIDDDAELRQYARRCIETLHGDIAEVVDAEDALRGLSLLAVDRVDLVICDLQMPGMSGHELVAALRKDPETRGIPVLVVTGDALAREARARLEALPGVQVLLKPFNAQRLCGAVEHMLKARPPPDPA